MHALSRKWVASLGVGLALFLAYQALVKPTPNKTSIGAVEDLVEAYDLKFRAETNTRTHFVVAPDCREIHVCPSWSRIELSDTGGTSIHGVTSWNVSFFGASDLHAALAVALNESPANAMRLVAHADDRVQFLLLKVLSDWGHNVRSFVDAENPGEAMLWALEPFAVDALTTLAQRDDPHTVGVVISALGSQERFSTEVFLAAMDHDSSNIRAEALRWLNPMRHRLTSEQLQAITPVLIDHLTDNDLVVRQWSMVCMQSVAAYWEHSLGGAPYDLALTHQQEMSKLPVAPASSHWYRNVFPQSTELAKNYQDEWQAWLADAEKAL